MSLFQKRKRDTILGEGEAGTAVVLEARDSAGVQTARWSSSRVRLQVTPATGDPFEWSGKIRVRSNGWNGGPTWGEGNAPVELPVRFSPDRAQVEIDWDACPAPA